jgi:hypothetical protein
MDHRRSSSLKIGNACGGINPALATICSNFRNIQTIIAACAFRCVSGGAGYGAEMGGDLSWTM